MHFNLKNVNFNKSRTSCIHEKLGWAGLPICGHIFKACLLITVNRNELYVHKELVTS